MTEAAAFVLLLDTDGRVTSRAGGEGATPEDPSELMAPWSSAKCQLLVDTVMNEGGGYDWELDLAAPGGTVSLRSVGGRGSECAALGFGPTASSALEALELATRDLPGGDDILRNALRARFRGGEQTPAAQDDMFRELWRVNSELAAAHRELIRKNRELEIMRGDRNRMLGMVVHDLRSPLNVIRLAVGILSEGDPGPERVADLGRRMEGGVEMMLRLIDDLLDLSAVEAGELQLDLRTCDAGRIIERAASVVELVAPDPPVIKRAGACVDLSLVADPLRLEQVLVNLLDNAVRLTAPGTEIVLETKGDDRAIEIRVSDRGVGVPAELREKIFEPYQQAEGRGRAGLGLAISRRIVTEHGGRLWCEARPGGGATFVCSLPRNLMRAGNGGNADRLSTNGA